MKILINFLLIIALSSVCHAQDSIDLARVSLQEATQKILSDNKNRVLGARTEIIDGKEIHIIKVLTPDGRILHYKIDAETGAVIS
jgi:uncharacterized membrane protein YkoI